MLLLVACSLVPVVVGMGTALAQVSLHPTVTPVRNDGGWIFSIAWLMAVLATIVGLLLLVGYMRFAPRFSKDEENVRVVRADRVLPGREPPRRAVDLSQAAPVVVQPPAIPAMASASAAPAAAEAPAPDPAPAATPAAAEAPAPAPAAAETEAETTAEGDAAAATEAAPADAPAEAPADAPAAEAPVEAPAAAPAAPTERVEVEMDQEVFDAKLAELLEKGTDRRVAEGQARRAGMIAARKKAAGEG